MLENICSTPFVRCVDNAPVEITDIFFLVCVLAFTAVFSFLWLISDKPKNYGDTGDPLSVVILVSALISLVLGFLSWIVIQWGISILNRSPGATVLCGGTIVIAIVVLLGIIIRNKRYDR